MNHALPGFDAEFQSLDQYIRVITDRIWEGRRIDDIHRYYSAGCAVETPGGVSIGVQPVIEGTRATLLAFPDRRLLAEDVIVSGDAERGFLSSHRIFSPMTHAGPGVFGAPTGATLAVRTIADCVCFGNRIVHEWLVRDQAAIARQIGRHERELAQTWLNERGAFAKVTMPVAPAPYVSFIDSDEMAQRYAQAYRALWMQGDATAFGKTHSAQAIVALPAAQAAIDAAGLRNFWSGVRTALHAEWFTVEHLVASHRAGRATAIAMRWRAITQHRGDGRYGDATQRAVEVFGISHAEVENDRIVREWILIDDVALWMQVLQPQKAS